MRRRSRKIYVFGLLSPTTRSSNRLDLPVLSYQLLFANCHLLPFRSPDHPISRSPDPNHTENFGSPSTTLVSSFGGSPLRHMGARNLTR